MHKPNHRKKKIFPAIIAFILALLSWGFFASTWHNSNKNNNNYGIAVTAKPQSNSASNPKGNRNPVVNAENIIVPKITLGTAEIVAQSPKILAYAHGTATADGKLFIGMASFGGNTFPTNEILIFNGADISKPTIVRLPAAGDVTTMVYDSVNDKIYFDLGSNNALDLYSLDPHTYAVSTIISTSSLNTGVRPAIVTDGTYVYGITNTNRSSVFKVRISDGKLTVNSTGHIPLGHSAAIGIYGSTTELYFGGGMSNSFEKTDAVTLKAISSIKIEPCNMSNDTPFLKTASSTGYVYIGCEIVPYGIRINTGDMSFEKFSLPGDSFGLFKIGSDLYNAAQDGSIDIFSNYNLQDLRRYRVMDGTTTLVENGQNLEINKILFSPQAGKLYFTAWWGIKGLYQVSTSTDQN